MTGRRFTVLIISSLVLLFAYQITLPVIGDYLRGTFGFDYGRLPSTRLLFGWGLPVAFVFISSLAMGAFSKTTAVHYKILSIIASMALPVITVVAAFLSVCMYTRICL
jgi:hypothetical protein